METIRRILTAPSILSANFAAIDRAIKKVEDAGGDWVHLDVMDGRFVPNLTFGPKMVEDIRSLTRLPLDVHLMVVEPERLIPDFIAAGADLVTFHLEATVHAHRTLQMIKKAGVAAGVAIVPSTPLSAVTEILQNVDLILIMTVNPGFGGQTLIERCVDKAADLAELRRSRDEHFRISVDGGINRQTIDRVRAAGVDVVVTGSAFFSSSDPAAELRMLRGEP